MNRQKRQYGFDIDNPLDSAEGVVSDEKKDVKMFGASTSAILFSLFSFALIVLLGRSFYLQVIKGTYFQDIAENNRIREVVIRAPRGVIKDAEGLMLAQNAPSFDAVFIPAHLPQDVVKKENSIRIFSAVLSKSVDEVISLIDEKEIGDKRTYLIEGEISSDIALEIIERGNELPGFYVGKSAKRQYVDGHIFSHIIGYDGKVTKKELEENSGYIMTDYIGKDGIESSFERYLHGVHGARRFEVDSNSHIKEDLGTINPVQGDTLILHIDAQLQKHANEVVEKILEENPDATGAVVVAIDPRDGGVKILLSLPSYDNNLFSGGITGDEYAMLLDNEKKPLLNRAIAGEYPPGSIFKPVVAATALQENVITEHTIVNCLGAIHIGQWAFPDWKIHGPTDVKKAIAESCDVFFYSIGGGWGDISGLGINRINQYARTFGFGDVVGIDLPGEVAGNLPDSNWKFKTFGEKWYIGDSYHAAIGQGYVTVTPLQTALATATIANGGTVYRPHVVDKVVSSQTKDVHEIGAEVIENVMIDDEPMRIVREGMRQTVTGSGGSGRSLGSLEVSSAGKTGTAQFGNEDKTHSWYISFAPYDDPEIAMVVLIESGGDGHDWAVPATKEIFKWYFDQERGTKTDEKNDGGEFLETTDKPVEEE